MKTNKNLKAIIVISTVCCLAVFYNIWAWTRSNPVPKVSVPETSSPTQGESKSGATLSEDEWSRRNAEILDAARREFEELSKKNKNIEDEKVKLADELSIAIEELDKMKVDLQLKEPPELDVKAISESYEKVGKLVTLEYKYEYISKAADNGKALSLFGSGDLIFWDNKEFLYKIPGTMFLGVDFSSINNNLRIDRDNKTIFITIPIAYIIGNDPDSQNVERYDIQKGWLNSNPVTDEDLLNAFNSLEIELKQKMQNNGMLKYAQELAGHQIKDLLSPMASISGYSISIIYDFY
jgi:hypothetical protein